ncbi:hypothetical protein AYL99_00252 [Fonsecaea erecta]|uniref:Xylanolytic transcriptional activator regulatory domain-containing protein n=1 Tax=Fonsecaea erecta TaxID=1367422 RepID=A0A178ZWS1_9EURO|nr:hypothetical protein AYL99_00252 [Fonsecaea erecta]OAP64280.1 hypothetical protein AYL99_00252 [Fonsecaea erecta]
MQYEYEQAIDVFSDQNPGDNSLYAADTINFECYGPRCMMSFYTQSAVDWMDSKVKSPEYSSTVKRLMLESARMLKMSRAYFEEGIDLAWGLVDRTLFETRLHAHFSGVNIPVADDTGWYALRNIIWAHGCQIVLSKTRTFHETLETSWALFRNALSVHTEIVLLHPSLIGVQALISMAYFSEGIGELALQYTLCTDALRLACSKGFHRQPSPSWKIPPHEVEHRNWTFWSIYCLEKQLCSRSGRPSMMDDDEIDCHVPQNALSGRPNDTLYCNTLVKMMQLSSTVRKQLASARALKQSTQQLVQAIRGLKNDLKELKSSVKQDICLDSAIDVARLPGGLTLRQAQSLQSHYFCLVLDINTPLTYPWLGIYAYLADTEEAASEMDASHGEVAQISRSAIMATRQINIHGSCSALVTRYAPMYSFVNLFLHILRDSTLSAAPSDLLLLEVALGYFSNLEYVTSFRLPRLFVREMCHYAHLAIEHKDGIQVNSLEQTPNRESEANEAPQAADLIIAPEDLNYPSSHHAFEHDFSGFPLDEDLETWNTLIPFEEAPGSIF